MKESEIAEQKRKEYKNTPHEEMFRALREEGCIVSMQELWEINQLTPKVIHIWNETVKEMFLLSSNPEKIRLLADIKHVYFITYEQYDNWEDKLKIYLDTLAGLNTLNSFAIINSSGCLRFLNPLGEPIDDSHDDVIMSMFNNFFKKNQSCCRNCF